MSPPAKLLLIDDLAENIEVLARHLVDDYDIVFALSGPEGLARAAEMRPDLILLDAMMPGMDGYAACAALKADVAARDIPILFVTAKNDAESESRALAAGAVDFIHKPVNRDVVRARIRLHLDLTAQRRALEALNTELARFNADLERRVEERTHALRDALRRAEASHRAKHLFLANINHGLRTPMNAILGLSELLVRQPAAPRVPERVANIREACQQLLGMINEVIDIADLQAGRIELQAEDFALAALLDSAAAAWRGRAAAKGLGLAVDTDPELPARLRGDSKRLAQILENFLRNAVTFSERGMIAVRARRVGNQGEAMLARFEVEDQGIGIDEPHRARIFDAFEQVDGSYTRQYGGAGIGLAICKQLADIMGGRIGVESVLGQGSTFWITLPLDPAAPAKAHAIRPEPAAEAAGQKPRDLGREAAQPMLAPLLGMLATNDIQAYMIWQENGYLLDPVLGERADAFHRAMAEIDFPAALDLLKAARGHDPA